MVWVFSNISGLVSVLPNGAIYSCNKNFTLMLFGYSDNELVGKVCGCEPFITNLVMLFQAVMKFLSRLVEIKI